MAEKYGEYKISMELSSILQQLKLSSASPGTSLPLPSRFQEGHYCPPITEVLGQLREKLIGAPEKASNLEATAVIGHIEQLFRNADPHWLFSVQLTNQDDGLQKAKQQVELENAYVGLFQSLTQWVALPLCETDSGSLPASSYQGIPARALSVCSALAALLRSLGDWERGTEGPRSVSLVHSVAPLCCVFAVTHFQEQPWTSAASRDAASSLLRDLLRSGGWRDPGHLLMGNNEEEEEEEEEGRGRGEQMLEGKGKWTGILGGILDVLQPELTKERWHRCEAVKLVFSWSLLQVLRPTLSPHLPRLFPPSLLFSDHHRLENRILGVTCLHHLVLNTPAADLRQYNRAEVLYQALYNHLYTNEATLIQVVLPCLLDLLPVLEKPPSHPSPSPRKPGRHDNVLRLLLTHMEMEHKLVLQRVYASSLPLYIDRMDIAISRHLKRVERVVVGYLEVSDAPEEQSRLGVLDALEKILSIAWPRMESRVSVLLKSLLRLLVDVSSDSLLSASVREQLMEKTTHCLTLLDHGTSGKLQRLLQQVDSSCVSGPVLSCLEMVTMATQR